MFKAQILVSESQLVQGPCATSQHFHAGEPYGLGKTAPEESEGGSDSGISGGVSIDYVEDASPSHAIAYLTPL